MRERRVPMENWETRAPRTRPKRQKRTRGRPVQISRTITKGGENGLSPGDFFEFKMTRFHS
eukprot:scaffold22432_cov168-Amphora_coffeaeformis.AAC.25